MRKDKRTPSRTIALFALCLLAPAILWGAISEEQQLLALRIENADWATLAEMAGSLGLATDTPDQMRSALLAHHGLLLERTHLLAERGRDFELTIAEAESIKRLSSSLFIAEGGVSITIKTIDDGRSRTIAADRLIIDTAGHRLTAHGSVRFVDDGQIGSVDAAILSIDWKGNDLYIVDALLYSEHDKKEKGEERLLLYSRSQEVSSISLGDLTVYRRGVIAMKSDDPLSSIAAKEMVFRPGGDLLVKGATLRIGRVPVLYLPFFPFIQNRMVGNPSVGINSERGMFVSTTWELFGRYPKIGVGGQSEAVALFAKADDEDLVAGPVIYTASTKPSPLEAWARDTSSHLALFGDAYQHSGVSVGLDARLSPAGKRLTISGLALLAFDPEGRGTLTTRAAVPMVRYLAEPVVRYDSSWATVSLDLPLYSDPSVKSLYANRLTAFTVEGPLGKKMEFPTDFTGDITTTTWKLNASFTFSTTATRPYLSTLSIPTLTAQVTRRYQKIGTVYGWQYTNVVLPNFTARAAGTLLSIKGPVAGKPSAPAAASVPLPAADTDALLVPFYAVEGEKRKSTVSASREITLSYSAEQRLNQRLDPASGEGEYLYSFSKASLRLYATPHSNLLTITEELVPQISIVEDVTKLTFHTREAQLFLTSRIAVPLIGLEYQLSGRLARTQVSQDSLGVTTIQQGFAFTKEQVTVHRLSLAKIYTVATGSIKPSVTLVLPPLSQSLTPSLVWQGGPYTLSSSATFTESEGALKPELVKASFKYRDGLFAFTAEPTYRLSLSSTQWYEPLSLAQSFSFQSPAKFWKVSQSLSYAGLSANGVAHAIDRLSVTAEIPHLQLSYALSGPIDALKPLELKGTVALLDGEARFYKRRIALFWGVESSLLFHFTDWWASRLELEATLGLSIAEFLDCKLTVKSVNTGFYRYYDDSGAFVFANLWHDLLRSFDFVGSGRENTQFNLNSIAFDLVHDLGDWSLNCKYSASVVLSNNQYQWVPTVSVFLSWKVLSELDIAERWTRESSQWVRFATT